MKRHLRNILAGGSLGICVLAILLGVYSCFYIDGAAIRLGHKELIITTTRGQVTIDLRQHPAAVVMPQWGQAELRVHHWSPGGPIGPRSETSHRFLGIGIGLPISVRNESQRNQAFLNTLEVKARELSQLGDTRMLAAINDRIAAVQKIESVRPKYLGRFEFPLWLVVLLTSLLPIRSIRAYLRERARRMEGHCLKCGYDLRASLERCPECGTAVPSTEPEPRRHEEREEVARS